jgi:hypothetical protein
VTEIAVTAIALSFLSGAKDLTFEAIITRWHKDAQSRCARSLDRRVDLGMTS